jgi:hypothetical protein
MHAFDTDNTVDEKGYYRVTTSVLVTLRFDDVRESELRDLGSQNVLSSLDFELDASVEQRLAWHNQDTALIRRGELARTDHPPISRFESSENSSAMT